jgi:hypothetical protein
MAEEKGEGHADCLPPKSGRLIFLTFKIKEKCFTLDYGAF